MAIKGRGLCHTCYGRMAASGSLPRKRHQTFLEWWELVDKTGDGCWYWPGPKSQNGYGMACGPRGTRGAYTYSFELAGGILEPGLTVDHTCHNQDRSCKGGSSCPHRLCVRPSHLEAVTNAVNRLRSHNAINNVRAAATVCQSGRHQMSGANVLARKSGRRECRACRNEGKRMRYRAEQQRKSAAA